VSSSERNQRDLARLLRTVPLFSGLPQDDCDILARAGRTVRVEPQVLLFRQGDRSDAMYVVLNGRLEATVSIGTTDRLIRAFKRGEVIGELGLLAGTPRSASIRAVRESDVLRIDEESFVALINGSPTFALSLARALAHRLQQSGPSLLDEAPPPRVIAIVFLRSDLRQILPPLALARCLRQWGSVSIFEQPQIQSAFALAHLLREREENSDRVLLVAEAERHDSPWTSFCLRQADAVLVVAAPGTPLPAPEMGRALAGCRLLLLGRPSAWADIVSWLDRVGASGHQFIESADDEALERLARRTVGRAVGLVLSGGGARGLAHIGVIEVLHERGIRVDRIGGCSMGAFIAGLLALGMSANEMHELCREELVRRKPFADYTIPRVALIRAARAEAMLKRVFSDTRIELLNRDFFCVSADLMTANVVVHRRGELSRAVGTSMSLPGLAPPVIEGDKLLVDGGVLDNLPIDVMAADSEGPIIAVDVMRRLALEGTQKQDQKEATIIPTILETLSRATALGSWHLAARNQAQAAVVITPDLPAIGTFDWRQIDTALEAGREAAQQALQAWETISR
jgi:NTE family protein